MEQALQLRSMGALPFTSARVSARRRLCAGNGLRTIPPSRSQVRPPNRMTTSPGAGSLLTDVALAVGVSATRDRADLHALGGVAGVVQLGWKPITKTDLVAIAELSQRR